MIVNFAIENDANDFHYHWQADIQYDDKGRMESADLIGKVECRGYDSTPPVFVDFDNLPLTIQNEIVKKMEAFEYW